MYHKFCQLNQLSEDEKSSLYELYVACFDDQNFSRWSEKGLADILFLEGVYSAFCYRDNGKARHLLGLVIWRVTGEQCEILNIGILPSERNKGVGFELLMLAESSAKKSGASKIFLEVAESNKPAIKLYKKAGFNKVSVREKYYKQETGAAQDAHIMTKTL